MTTAESILPEFDIEMAGTRRTLECIPEEKLGWKAHEKSNTIGWVACHLASNPPAGSAGGSSPNHLIPISTTKSLTGSGDTKVDSLGWGQRSFPKTA